MQKHLLIPLTILLLATSPLLLAFPKTSLVPGGVAAVELGNSDNTPRFTFRDKPVLIAKKNDSYFAIVGLPLSLKPGEYFISGNWGDDTALEKKFFSVGDKEYTTQRINIKDKRKVNPYESDMDRIWAEQKRQKKARRHYSKSVVDIELLQPTEGIMTGSFGRRRIFNGEARRPHSGMDIAAAEGVPILAPSKGRVIELGNFFFSGKLVYVDHGQGMISLFAHMSEIDVSLGQQIEKGDIIGKVGATGRVTGPHLHWSLGLNGSWVDPSLFLP
jgi:murein DD-endopeptidase MepM/ murein hydrolase activator NlpD